MDAVVSKWPWTRRRGFKRPSTRTSRRKVRCDLWRKRPTYIKLHATTMLAAKDSRARKKVEKVLLYGSGLPLGVSGPPEEDDEVPRHLPDPCQ